MLEKLINILYPATCPICGKVLRGKDKICGECEKDVVIIREPKCQKCGKPLITDEKIYCNDCGRKKRFFDKGVAVFRHSGRLRESIYRFKYNNARVYADYYGSVAAHIYGKMLKEWDIDAIIPVPIHRARERKRGYNQALVFARSLAKYTGFPLEKKLLIRKKKTMPQKELTETMRYFNLKDAFAVDKDRMKQIENILLVDDIFTTGSTVDACSSILKKAGAKKVYVLCISAGVDKEECHVRNP